MSQNPNDSQNFMDPKTLIAIVLSGLLFVGWNSYLKSKYPQPEKKVVSEQVAEESETFVE
ncbi:MAG: hypothetical protein R2827_01850 [Bdellovibrionales bacterium]